MDYWPVLKKFSPFSFFLMLWASVNLVIPNKFCVCVCYGGSDYRESSCNAGAPDLIPGLGRSPGEGIGNTPQYSCLENFMDRGAWWATICGAAESDMTEQLTHSHSLPVQARTAQCTIGQ